MELGDYADRIEKAALSTIAEGRVSDAFSPLTVDFDHRDNWLFIRNKDWYCTASTVRESFNMNMKKKNELKLSFYWFLWNFDTIHYTLLPTHIVLSKYVTLVPSYKLKKRDRHTRREIKFGGPSSMEGGRIRLSFWAIRPIRSGRQSITGNLPSKTGTHLHLIRVRKKR